MPLVLGRGQGWDVSVPHEPSEVALYAKIKACGSDGYKIHRSELLQAYSLYYRGLIREHGEQGKECHYIVGRGW